MLLVTLIIDSCIATIRLITIAYHYTIVHLVY